MAIREFPYGLLNDLSKIKSSDVNVTWLNSVLNNIKNHKKIYDVTCESLMLAMKSNTSLIRGEVLKAIYVNNLDISRAAKKLKMGEDSIREYLERGLMDIRESSSVKYLLTGVSDGKEK